MTDRAQFEAMLEALINEDQETAKEIFHNIVVAKSREIYEELLAEDFTESREEEEEEEEEESRTDEMFGAEEEGEEEEEEGAEEEEGEEEEEGADDEAPDFGADDEEGAEDGELEDRVLDLEDALEELKAEFEELMAGEEGEGHHDDMGGMDDMGAELGGDDMGGELDELGMPVMEYVNKVAPPKHGDDGQNTKSPVAGKNDMGGTTANIVKGGESKTGGTQGGLLKPTTKEDNAGNVNVPGAKSATKLSNVPAGHGAEKKGKSETADKSAGSPINGVKTRAK